MTTSTETKDVSLLKLITEVKNPRGIPSALFIENVEDFLKDSTVEAMLGAYQELYGKYKYMESSFEKSKGIYKGKIPDIEQTLDMIRLMASKREENEDMIANYSLSDTVYAKAKVTRNAANLVSIVYVFVRSILGMEKSVYG